MATYNYTVTASGNSYYLWNGHGLVDAQNPDLFFRAGDTVTITNASGGHPMRITNDAAPSVGVIDESGGVISVDSVSEGSFTYFCTSHPSAMKGAIVWPIGKNPSFDKPAQTETKVGSKIPRL